MFRISIPKPCSEDWNKMQPGNNGRYCGACATAVTDFTVMTDEEIQQYLTQQQGQRNCGRFTTTQLKRLVINLPQKAFVYNMPAWKKILIACLVIFGTTIFPFETAISGQPLYVNTASQPNNKHGLETKKWRVIKKESKKKRRKSKCVYSVLNSVLGNFETISMPQPESTIFTPHNKVSDNFTKTSLLVQGPVDNANKKEKDPLPSPFPSTEFILPVSFALKTPSKKKR